MALVPTSSTNRRPEPLAATRQPTKGAAEPVSYDNPLQSSAIHDIKHLRASEGIARGLEDYDQRNWKTLLKHVRALGDGVADNCLPLWNLLQRTSILPLKRGIIEALATVENLPKEMVGYLDRLIHSSDYPSLAVAAARARQPR